MKLGNTKKLILAALFMALGLVLPFLTAQIPQIGKSLCPMHLPVILCGFFCGPWWGLAVGCITPLLRSLLFGMPIIFPKAIAMAFELGGYGFFIGLIYNHLPKRKVNIYVSLILSMVLGRMIYAVAMFLMAGLFTGVEFSLSVFWSSSILEAVPGIILQIIVIPVVVMACDLWYNKTDNK